MMIYETNTNMKYVFSILFICYFSVAGYTQNTKPVKADILLDNDLLKQLEIDDKFINAVEYTSDGFILLSSSSQFYLLGIGGIVPIFESWDGRSGIESFAVTAEGILIIVSGNTLYQANLDPSFTKVLDIPDRNMGVSSKYKDIYVFDRIWKNSKKNYSIYKISENKKITTLVEIPTPILAVFEQSSLLIFSTKNTLLGVDINTKNLFHLLALPQEDEIISIVGDTINHAFYFSTYNTIYQIKESEIEVISEDFGGILRYDGEGLLIFNPEKQLIIRLRNNLLYLDAKNVEIH